MLLFAAILSRFIVCYFVNREIRIRKRGSITKKKKKTRKKTKKKKEETFSVINM